MHPATFDRCRRLHRQPRRSGSRRRRGARASDVVGFDGDRAAPIDGDVFIDATGGSGGPGEGHDRDDQRTRLERAIAIKMVVGWRIQLMVRLGREVPELPAEVLFSDIELRVLTTFARSRDLAPPQHLGEAVHLLARLGGWLGRTRDPPGAQLLWHGYTRLAAMTFAFELRDKYG